MENLGTVMDASLGKNLIGLFQVWNAAYVEKRNPEYSVQTQYNDKRGALGNPTQPETRSAGVRGDVLYYFA